LTGDEFDAEEALRIGIIQEIVAPGEELRRALELAQIIAERAPLAVQATLLNARTYALRGEEAASAEFMDIQARMAASEDFQEGVQSFIEKRPAQFTGR
jgi:enoyl-CoA hydratase/carnithine racemase